MQARAAGPGAILAGCALLGAAGCATLTPVQLGAMQTPIVAAATTPPTVLKARAEAGEAPAQYAYGLMLEHGLQGQALDAESALRWKSRALAARSFRPLTTYVAGYKGHPSRVMTTLIPVQAFSSFQAAAVEGCARQLSGAPRGLPDPSRCGDAESFARLRALWDRAGGIRARSPA